MPRTWTEHTIQCRSCGHRVRLSAEGIAEQRRACFAPDTPDAEVAPTIDFCLKCLNGDEYDGERVERHTLTSAESQTYIDTGMRPLEGETEAEYFARVFPYLTDDEPWHVR